MYRIVALALCQLLAFSIFTIQFLNIRRPVKTPNSNFQHPHIRQDPLVDRMVFMVIDALRSDFVFSDDSPMSFVKRLLSQGQAKGFIAKATAPTVTLPRLKALTAGTPPVFLDFLANLDERSSGKNEDNPGEDSWVKQLYLAKKRMVFLGDDTWLRLFPDHYFIRTDPTTSFYVKDTVIVDRNVTRHVDEEFGRKDWDVLIMHYLGVDHIGHVEGAKGPLMKPKLVEMDNVIEQIHGHLTSDPTKRTVMFVLGDHGMTDSGNHGGSSPEEVNTAFLAISHPHSGNPSHLTIETINQLDIAPTISSLFGVPIPQYGIGKVVRQLLEGRVSDAVLSILLHNNLVTLSKQDPLVKLERFQKCQTCSDCKECIDEMEKELESSRERISGQYGTFNIPVLVLCLLVSTLVVSTLSKDQSNMDRLATVFYCLSIMASSFIEEEHEIWNHVLPLIILVSNHTTTPNKLTAMLCARVLRPWNSNGYEYRSLPDMKMFLEGHQFVLSVFLIAALSFFAMSGRSRVFKSLLVIYASIILACKSGVAKGPGIERLILSLGTILATFDSASLGLLLIAISKTHNAVPIALLSVIQKSLSPTHQLLSIHHAYFAMGMSNLITSIDLSNSYLGLSEYNPTWVGLMTFTILFAGPLQSTFMHGAVKYSRVLFWRASVQLAVMLCCFIQRHHISVWTIFTPRLLFEVLWTAFYGLFFVPINMRMMRRVKRL